jgi:hypothetical protein
VATLGRPPIHGHSRVGGKGGSPTPTYRTWKGMLQRCRDINDTGWKYYGGRGISVCEEWYDFSKFLADMGERPKGKTLDRIDRDGNYEPSNCRWATPVQQAKNRRREQ